MQQHAFDNNPVEQQLLPGLVVGRATCSAIIADCAQVFKFGRMCIPIFAVDMVGGM